jgi:hypothetical protein
MSGTERRHLSPLPVGSTALFHGENVKTPTTQPLDRILYHVIVGLTITAVLSAGALGQSSSQTNDPRQAIQNLKSIFKKKPTTATSSSGATNANGAAPGSGTETVAASAPTSSVPSGDCCTPEAMKRIASSLGYLDVVGVKLGMTPEQAFTAIKAHNPKLKIDTIHARLQHPTAPDGTFVRVPEWVMAHTVHPGANTFAQPDYSMEVIGLEFTTPPSPPLVAKIARFVQFPNGQPVLLSTLLDGLQKKYGPENSALNDNRVWVFDTNGKPVTRYLTPAERVCDPGNWVWDFPDRDIRGGPSYSGGDSGGIRLNEHEMEESQILYERHAACVPLTFVAASGVGPSLAPNSPVTSMQVVILSPALLRYSQQATHDWLQAELNGKMKQQQDADAKRPAPKF